MATRRTPKPDPRRLQGLNTGIEARITPRKYTEQEVHEIAERAEKRATPPSTYERITRVDTDIREEQNRRDNVRRTLQECDAQLVSMRDLRASLIERLEDELAPK